MTAVNVQRMGVRLDEDTRTSTVLTGAPDAGDRLMKTGQTRHSSEPASTFEDGDPCAHRSRARDCDSADERSPAPGADGSNGCRAERT